MRGIRVLLCWVVILSAEAIQGCDLCAIYAASRARGEVGSGVFAGVAEQWTYFGTLQVDGREVPNLAGQWMDSSISQLFAGYNFNNRFGVQFNAPLIYRSFKRPDGFGQIEQGTESGLGDVALVGNFVAYQQLSEKFTLTWNLLGGVKFPTGGTKRLKEELHEMEEPVGPPSGIHGHDLTLGTGSYDAIVGTSVYARRSRGFIGATVQYAIRSGGDFDYRFANDLTWSGGPGCYLLLKDELTLSFQAVVSGEDKGLDDFHGIAVEDTGLTAVYLGPQLAFTWGSHFSTQAGVDCPVSIRNTAFQMVPDYRVRAAVTWHF